MSLCCLWCESHLSWCKHFWAADDSDQSTACVVKICKLLNSYLSLWMFYSLLKGPRRTPCWENTERNSVWSTPWLLLSNFLALLRDNPFQCRSCPGALHFSSQRYFYPPSCQWVSVEHGGHKERETCRVTLTWILGTGGGGGGNFSVSPPFAAWQGELGGSLLVQAAAERHWGNLGLQAELCGSKSIHLDLCLLSQSVSSASGLERRNISMSYFFHTLTWNIRGNAPLE